MTADLVRRSPKATFILTAGESLLRLGNPVLAGFRSPQETTLLFAQPELIKHFSNCFTLACFG
ncbi:hypothetical protein [Sphingobium mellinum]|uniref:hypothetical protein n=1 Tax=Sphingobium mellinum TaxID=1387166 RepID=UPI0030ECB10F